MSIFFGKREESWHISYVITRAEESKFEVESVIQIFDNCMQNNCCVASIVEHLLNTIKQESPQMKILNFKSDNAWRCNSGPPLLSLPITGKRTGIKPVRYNFSDPQSGKDIRNQKAATMKLQIRRWVSEKHYVLTALDMENALELHGGVKGYCAVIVQVDSRQESVGNDNKILGTSLLNNFVLEEGGVHVWRACNNAPGKLLPHSELGLMTQDDTNLQILHGVDPRVSELSSIRDTSIAREKIFSCANTNCVPTFMTFAKA